MRTLAFTEFGGPEALHEIEMPSPRRDRRQRQRQLPVQRFG
jgi:hypothetical protein